MAEWLEKKIGDFLFERQGKYKPADPQIEGLKRIDKIDFSGNFHIGGKASRTNMILVHPGDLVISGINVAKGAMGIYSGKDPVTATIHYSSYTFDEKQIDVDYFKRFLKSPEFIRLLNEQVKGGIKTEIKPKHILPLQISIPPLGEQKDIVSHFKSIETEDQDLKHELTHQQSLRKKLRQQILQEAIEGKLTADWRKQNPDVEPASELLKRIQEEKEQLIAEKKIRKQKPLPVITAEEIPFDIPDGWEWCRLGELGDIRGGGTPSKNNEALWGGDIPWVCPKDMKRKYIDGSIFQITSEATLKSSAKLISKDSLMFVVRGMILAHTFPVAIAQKEVTVNQDMKAFLPHLKGFHEYYYLALKGSALAILKRVKTSTHGTCRLESAVYLNWLVALPPLAEQKAIVAKVEQLLALCDQLEARITNNQTHADQLMQSVLKEAFAASA